MLLLLLLPAHRHRRVLARGLDRVDRLVAGRGRVVVVAVVAAAAAAAAAARRRGRVTRGPREHARGDRRDLGLARRARRAALAVRAAARPAAADVDGDLGLGGGDGLARELGVRGVDRRARARARRTRPAARRARPRRRRRRRPRAAAAAASPRSRRRARRPPRWSRPRPRARRRRRRPRRRRAGRAGSACPLENVLAPKVTTAPACSGVGTRAAMRAPSTATPCAEPRSMSAGVRFGGRRRRRARRRRLRTRAHTSAAWRREIDWCSSTTLLIDELRPKTSARDAWRASGTVLHDALALAHDERRAERLLRRRDRPLGELELRRRRRRPRRRLGLGAGARARRSGPRRRWEHLRWPPITAKQRSPDPNLPWCAGVFSASQSRPQPSSHIRAACAVDR